MRPPHRGPSVEFVALRTTQIARCHARAALPDVLAAIEAWRPDVVVRESFEFASCVAAEHLGVPQVRVGRFLSSAADVRCLADAAPVLDELRAGVGLSPDPGAAGAADTPYFTLAPPSVEDASRPAPRTRRFRARVEHLVASLPEQWGDAAAPLVYVSLGAELPPLDFVPGLHRAVVDEVAGLPVRVLVSVGDFRDPAELGPLPPSVRVERWVPHAAVMSRAAVLVTHGGFGSTLAALAAGVPVAFLPQFAQQPDNARRVARRGAGIALKGGPAALGGLQAAVGTLLDDPGYRRAAWRLRREIAALPPVDEAVAELEAIARDGVRAA